MKEDVFSVGRKPRPRFGTFEFVYYKPNFKDINELYRVNDEPINIINNSENVPFIQNVAQQQLVDVSIPSFDTSGLSDEQLASSVIPRYADINEIADASSKCLSDLNQRSNIKS